jgi:hypothetical protein
MYKDTNSWSDPVQILPEEEDPGSHSLTIDPNGNRELVYVSEDSTGENALIKYYNSSSAGAVTVAQYPLCQTWPCQPNEILDITDISSVRDSSGVLHVAYNFDFWEGDGPTYYMYKDESDWSVAEQILTQEEDPGFLSLTIDTGGNPELVYTGWEDATSIVSIRHYNSSSADPVTLANYPFCQIWPCQSCQVEDIQGVSSARDLSGRLHVVYAFEPWEAKQPMYLKNDCDGIDVPCLPSNPSPPTGLSATYDDANAWNWITWNPVDGATSYNLYWGTEPDVTEGSQFAGNTCGTEFSHTSVEGGSTYYYKVMALNLAGESELSAEESVDVPITLNPIVSVSPPEGPWGTFFTLSGSGFTPFNRATGHFLGPGSMYFTHSRPTDSSGNFTDTLDTHPEQIGQWEYYAVDDASGIQSPSVYFTVTRVVDPQVRSTSGSLCSDLIQQGWWFTPGGTAELHFRRPDGSLSPLAYETVSPDGNYNRTWPVPPDAQIGVYRYWAVDLATGLQSPEVNYSITGTPPDAPTLLSATYDSSVPWNYLTWTEECAYQYVVYWGTSPGVTKDSNKLDPTDTLDYGHPGESGWRYYYRVSAVNAAGESELSNERYVDVP